jgi:acetylornithine deacetylase/succinyl-diaminopimelate desuccinylase-like protein
LPPADTNSGVRALLRDADRRDQIVAITRRLVAVASPNPPLDTGAVAAEAAAILRETIPGIEVELVRASDEVVNVVARVHGRHPGRRLVFSGHLDTYPAGDARNWTVEPLGGIERDGRLYGRGASDMKGGIAASIVALALLAEHRHAWSGEAVLALGGDEESMGVLGCRFLLETVPHVKGDAVIIGDAGSSKVVRFGEKGFLWIAIEADGVPAHGAHVHRGVNAIDRLRAAMDALSGLRCMTVATPAIVRQAIEAAKPISEPLSGAGEAEVLTSVTVNLGRIEGGVSPNLIPSAARVAADIRIPVGLRTAEVEAALRAALAGIAGIRLIIERRTEPAFTDPGAAIIRMTVEAAAEVLGEPPACNMRVGASDARIFREAGIPTVVYGPAPFNMGGADEYVMIGELENVMRVHALAAFDFLTAAE